MLSRGRLAELSLSLVAVLWLLLYIVEDTLVLLNLNTLQFTPQVATLAKNEMIREFERRQAKRKAEGFMTVPLNPDWTFKREHLAKVLMTLTGCTEDAALAKITEWHNAQIITVVKSSKSGFPQFLVFPGPPRQNSRSTSSADILADAAKMGIVV